MASVFEFNYQTLEEGAPDAVQRLLGLRWLMHDHVSDSAYPDSAMRRRQLLEASRIAAPPDQVFVHMLDENDSILLRDGKDRWVKSASEGGSLFVGQGFVVHDETTLALEGARVGSQPEYRLPLAHDLMELGRIGVATLADLPPTGRFLGA